MHGSSIAILLVQIGLILALSRVMGALFALLRQPQVIGEMVAGILLGPSLLGWLSPAIFQSIFPAQSIPYLNNLSQIGVIFFLFLIGLELDPKMIVSQSRAALGISISSIATPFILGAALTFYLYNDPQVFQDISHAHFRATILFMGAAISITAFPVLARILTERNLHKTPLGAISITSAAANDAIAWCILAFVVAVAKYQGPRQGIQTALLVAGYIGFMLVIVRPFLRRLQIIHDRQGQLSQNVIAVILLLVLASAYTTERIGIHALFGAFLLGAIMPKGSHFVRALGEKLEDYTIVFLLPVFFAYNGLQTQITLLNSSQLWLYAGLIILIACIGKIGGASLAARLCGMKWRESTAVGVLMNTRGLMELVILNIGRELGVINDTVFAMMVIMALVTTALTSPLLHWVYPARLLAASTFGRAKRTPGAYSILIPVSMPRTVPPLVQLADILTGPENPQRLVLAAYLRRPVDHEAYRSGLNEDMEPPRYEPLAVVVSESKKLNLPVESVSFVSRDVSQDIAKLAEARQVDLVLMGFHKAVFSQSILGGTVHHVLTDAHTNVAIFVDRGFHGADQILVPYLGSPHDKLAMELASRMARTVGAHVTILHVVPPKRGPEGQVLGAQKAVERVFNEPNQPTPVTFRVVEHESPVDVVLEQAKNFDLVIIGVAEEWGLESQLFGWRAERIARDCPTSLLIVRKYIAAPAAHPAGLRSKEDSGSD